jgi:integrase
MDDGDDPFTVFDYAIRSAETRASYHIWLKKFFSDIGLVGTIQEQSVKFVQSSKDTRWPLRTTMGFLQLQRQRVDHKEIVGSTVRNYVKAVRLFCEMNDIVINWKKLTRGLPTSRRWADDRAPTVEEIRKIVEYPDRRIKAIVYTMLSSGIRLGAWNYLKWGHIIPTGLDGVAKIRVYVGEEEEYWTFITPEAYKALQEWMDFRKRAGENVTKDSWVMRQLWDVLHGGPGGTAVTPKKLAPDGVKQLVESAIKTQGVRGKLEPGKRRHEFPAHHGFRKFFKTHAEQAMKPIHVEMLMGHSVGVSDSYYRPAEKDLLEDYMKAVPSLTIELVTATVIEQTQHLRVQMESKDKEMEDLKEQMSKMQQDFKSYDESVKEVLEKVREGRERQKWEEEKRKVMYETLDRLSPDWKEPYLQYLGKGRPLTKEARKKIEELQKLLISDDVD